MITRKQYEEIMARYDKVDYAIIAGFIIFGTVIFGFGDLSLWLLLVRLRSHV
ncbi:hypothetical protein LOS22_15200 [Enterococcus faecium]|nr:hypothetical protein [Enterococcus faecium]